jgi:hypothetical protein
VSGFVKFDPWAFLKQDRPNQNGPKTLAALATLAGVPSYKNNRGTESHPRPGEKPHERTPAKVAKPAKVCPDAFPFAEALDALERRRPEYVEPERWQQCLIDAQRFLASWGDKAAALGWTADELFGLHEPPARPHPSYSRLSRYDCTGLLWLLQGRRVVALTADTSAIECGNGNIVTYRKHHKPALGPLGDSLDDFAR